MKTFFSAMLFLAFLVSMSSQSIDKKLWQDDIRFLQYTIHTKYANLFYNVTAQQFDSSIEKLIEKIPMMEDFEFYAGIGKIMAMFRIGHTQAGYLFQNLLDKTGEKLFPAIPIEFYMFSDGFYIKSAAIKYQELVGAKIIQIGDLPISQALERIRPFVNYENEFGFLANAPFYLRFPKLIYVAGISNNKDKLKVKYEKSGQVKETWIDHDNSNLVFKTTGLEAISGWTDASDQSKTPIPIWKQHGDQYRNCVYLPETKTYYIRHSVTLNDKNQTLVKFFDEAYDFVEKNDVEKIVLDVRMNGGGNNQLIKPIITGIIQLKKINQKGKFFCIIGRRTFSACQNLVNELERYTEVIFVGEPTSENVNFYGDTKTETMPNSKIQVFCSWLWWQNSDPRDLRKYTSPHLSVDLSFNDYADNVDPVMKVIENYDIKMPFIESIKELELANKQQEATLFAQNFMKDPINKYFISRIEVEINTLGYRILNEKKPEAAKNIFKLNTILFPHSGNTYDSYAECCLLMGLRDEGNQYYRKALEAEPNYPNAEEAKKILSLNK